MHTAHRLERLLLHFPRVHRGIHVHWPVRARARARGILFQRVTRTGHHDAAALVALFLLICGLILTAAWMSQEVGRAMAIAAACDGDCPAAVVEGPVAGR